MTNHLNPNVRHDFVLFFDVKDGNPNGDPDAGNLPRLDPETMHGLVTDVCLKRKIRNYVTELKQQQAGFEIYVTEGAVLNNQHQRAYEEGGVELGDAKNSKKPGKDKQQDARAWMCQNFFDIRMFGAVMSTAVNCGQVRGPLQLTFARSVDPVVPMDLTITRIAVTTEKDSSENKENTMGRKQIVPYGLYRAHGFFSPKFARDTGVSSEDLKILWNSFVNMFELDRSASKGLMSMRGLYLFSHSDALGNAPAHRLFDLVHASRKEGIEVSRQFQDYSIQAPSLSDLPEGITFHQM